MEVLHSVAACILVSFSTMLLIVYSGLFDHVELDIGLEHYAEPAWLPVSGIMPLNSLINFGYICLGLYWCGFTLTATKYGVLKDEDSALFFTFNILSTMYGFIQLLRIVTQSVFWSVIDQWITFPFFSLLFIWGFYYQHGWSNLRAVMIMLVSLGSYSLTLYSKIGFEIALGCHIVAAVCGAVMAYNKYTAQESLKSFLMAIFCCLGFVVLKLLDLKLAEFCLIFRYVSGHFLSKICDIGQVYYVNNFFLDLTLQKSADESAEQQTHLFQHDERNGFCNNTNDVRYESVLISKHYKKEAYSKNK